MVFELIPLKNAYPTELLLPKYKLQQNKFNRRAIISSEEIGSWIKAGKFEKMTIPADWHSPFLIRESSILIHAFALHQFLPSIVKDYLVQKK